MKLPQNLSPLTICIPKVSESEMTPSNHQAIFACCRPRAIGTPGTPISRQLYFLDLILVSGTVLIGYRSFFRDPAPLSQFRRMA